jgi:preprotein translocase subunit SecD
MNRLLFPDLHAAAPKPVGPLNHYPLWKNLLILLVVLFSIVFAVPNLYKPDPAIQVSGVSESVVINDYQQQQALQHLQVANIAVKGSEMSNGSLIVRLSEQEHQLAAKEVLEKFFVGDYVVALNLVDTTPAGLAAIGAGPMKLGLDLSGGVHFLLQVDTAGMVEKRLESMLDNVEKTLKEADIPSSQWNAKISGVGIQVDFVDGTIMGRSLAELSNKLPEMERDTAVALPANTALLVLTEARKRELENYAVDQNLSALRSRINSLGVAEPVVQRQGRNRIVVELPGIQDTAEAKKIIGQTANLEFRLGAERGTLASRKQSFPMKQNPKEMVELDRKVILGGDCVEEVYPSMDQNNLPITVIHLNAACGRELHRATAKRVGRQMGIVLSETKLKTRLGKNASGEEMIEEYRVEEKQVISYANIRSALGSQFQIEGLSQSEAQSLSVLLRAGALAAPIYFVEERTVGPSMGKENIRAGLISAILGFALVCVFMLIYYRLFGLFANVALIVNLFIVVAFMSLFGATLTMPGIAGIVLLVGLAVDANVLIFSRIKEELKKGLSPSQAIDAGYDRAFITILDSNLTTLIVAVILFAVGTGPVQGFAITLSIGILGSMFTAITLTRMLANLWYGGRQANTLSI